jgi:hypothetical protein
MARVALVEVALDSVESPAARFLTGASFYVYSRGTKTEADLYDDDSAGSKLDQPLVADQSGRIRGQDGEIAWVAEGSYDIEYGDETIPWEAAKGGSGGGGGGAVDSVAGKTGVVTLEPDDIEGLSDRLPFVSVKAFGAKGDDDDDTEAIKAAIASFGGAGNSFGDTGAAQEAGVLYFPPGVFVTSETLKIFPGLVILGAGASATQLKLADGADCDLLQTEGFDELSGTESEEGPFKFAIRDIWLDGGEGSIEGRGVAIYGRYYLIDSVQISGFPGAGLWSKWAPSGDQMEASVRNVKIMGCGSPTEPALDWRGPHDSNFQDVQVIRPNGVGIRTSEGSAAGASFVNCHVWGETENYKIGWLLNQNAYLINCQGEGALETQLQINQGECIVIGGHYFGFGEVGEEGEHFPEGLRIATRASGSKVCVDFDQDSGKGEISILCEPREGGEVSTGTPATSSHVTLISDSPATSMHQAPKVNRTIASATSIEIPPGVVFVRISGSADIEEIEANADGQILILKFESSAKAVDSGNLHLNGDFEGEDAVLMLICDGADWFEIGREGGGAELGYTAENVANKDTDSALTANSDTKYPSQKAIKAYVDGLIAASDAVVYKGAKDCSANPKFPAADAGHLYRVSVAGKIGGGAGVNVEVGDTFLCNTDGAADGTQAEVGSKWNVIQANIDGALVGPSSATSGNLATFEGTTGKVAKDSGVATSTDGTLASNSDAKLPTEKAVKTYARPAGAIVWYETKTFTIPDAIAVPSGETDFIPPIIIALRTGQTAKVVKAVHKINAGTSATVKLQKNGADLTGFTGIEVKSEKKTTDPEDQSVADGDLLALVVTAISGSPKNLSFAVVIEQTVA